ARAQGKTAAAHLAHLVIHGVLHACGHDHERPEQAALMERIEVALLARFGIADPWRG
ncbi:MAG: rRNA maturation RNase YbeY, partial [Burkholderiales bacterium]